jgi:hypothetical protein
MFDSSPYDVLEKKDNTHRFLCLCSFISMCENKKMNLANVFARVYNNKEYMNLFFIVLHIDTVYELVRMFLEIEPRMYASKYINTLQKE